MEDNEALDTSETEKERDEKKHNLNEFQIRQSLVEPKPEKSRTDKDDDGEDLVALIIATDKLLSDAWSGHFPESELEKESKEIDHHSGMLVDALKESWRSVKWTVLCVWPTWRPEEIRTLCSPSWHLWNIFHEIIVRQAVYEIN